jgi:AcrR family transcriptional regulator
MTAAVKGGGGSLREQQAAATRDRILDAAETAFLEHGFAGTRIEDVAAGSGAAVPTVYKRFTNKPTLFAAVLHRAMTGHDPDQPIAAQAWFVEQLDEPDPDRQLALVARNARRLYERSGRLLEVLRAAAHLDRELAAIWTGIDADRLARARRTARSLLGKAPRRVRLGREETAVTLLTLTAAEVFTTHLATGRSAAQYERWLAHVLRAALLVPAGA